VQVQKINIQNFATNNRQSQAVTHPTFGLSIKTTEEFEQANIRFGIQDSVKRVLEASCKKYKNLDQLFEFDKGAINTVHGDVFGNSMTVFASRRPDDLKDAIGELAKKSTMLNDLSSFVEKLNKSKNINIEFEKNSIESPSSAIFFDFSYGAQCFKNIKSSIKDAAKALSKVRDKDNFTLKLSFNDKAIGVVKAKLVENSDANLSRSFDLTTKHNSDKINNFADEISNQKESNAPVDDPLWDAIYSIGHVSKSSS